MAIRRGLKRQECLLFYDPWVNSVPTYFYDIGEKMREINSLD